MKFGIIEPAKTSYGWVEAKEPWELYPQLGLPCDGGVDHGVLIPWHVLPDKVGIAIIVDQFSLFVPPEDQRYFLIGRHLYGGNAVLYGYNEEGVSVDLPMMPVIIFVTRAGIDEAIAAGQIDRPTSSLNGVKFWEWPQPSPFPLPGMS
jgi:hypothetical protein